MQEKEIQENDLTQEEKILAEWREAHADVYSKFKQDLEEELTLPYHQILLDLGDGNAATFQSVFINMSAHVSKDCFDFDGLYSKAVENDDEPAYCLLCYLIFDDGVDKLAQAAMAIPEDPFIKEMSDTFWQYRRFRKQNRKREMEDITTDELNQLTLRRWHYDHPKEYAEFMAMFRKAYDGDNAFIQNNFFFLMEMLSTKGLIGMVKAVASMFPGNMHYKQRLMGTDENPFNERISKILDTSLNNDTIRERLLRKNPYLFSLYYWIVFDNGFLHAADLISQTFLKPESPLWEKLIGRRCVEALIGASINKGKYSKGQWRDLCKQLKKGDAKKVIDDALREVKGRRGRRSTAVILEEMLFAETASILTVEIEKVLSEWKHLEGSDVILPYIFTALVWGNLTNDKYNYRTFHAAMQEKFPAHNINKGYNWAEAVYNAIISEDDDGNVDVSVSQIQRGKKHATDIKIRLLSTVNPNIE